ncbi:hypothetical protein [Campylobacter troglodytis]|uniref:hypothetical protein n=1 Tax=Campylobacter troglodytis TaxID=654363 RepID=UPI00115A7C38|nr:hypothetical protein [Campylobacter troglodytis]TQR61446.1 hypothetical protein DMC01_01430 [Campylobacter troglodytis]
MATTFINFHFYGLPHLDLARLAMMENFYQKFKITAIFAKKFTIFIHFSSFRLVYADKNSLQSKKLCFPNTI